MIKEEEANGLKAEVELVKKIEKVRNGFEMGTNVGLTKLGRSTEWRQKLEELGAFQVLDRDKTIGILLEPEIFKAMLDYMKVTEAELEQASFDALYERRKNTTEFSSGAELGSEALAIFAKRKKEVRRFPDGYK